uniref:Uncharacterized protein n=1 Tax=Trichogramma kaykai TaxID=54128 RepID=A0ABD2X4Z3_9HYME
MEKIGKIYFGAFYIPARLSEDAVRMLYITSKEDIMQIITFKLRCTGTYRYRQADGGKKFIRFSAPHSPIYICAQT